jgi:hypothetical protein
MKVDSLKLSTLLAACVVMAGCAQTGVPLPPSLELPKPPNDLRAMRKGNHVYLTWSEPTVTTDRQNIRYIGPTLICRSSESEISECGTPTAMLPAPSTSPAKQSNGRPALESYTDTLPASLQQPDPAADITYAVEILNRNARGAGLSNRFHIPAIITLSAPSDLAAQLTGDGVVLTWTNANTIPANPVGSSSVQFRYRIYRRNENPPANASPKDKKEVVAGEIPVGTPGSVQFLDSGFEWEQTYLYRVTAVSIVQRADAEIQIEGDDTPEIRVVAHDVFPPAVPTGLQAVYSGEGQKPFIDLIWTPVSNTDLAGYNIFRSEDGSTGEKMSKVNSEPVKTPSYRDTTVAPGKTYTYSVSAIDVRGNESAKSETAIESAPQ